MTTTAAHGFPPGTPGAQLHEHPIPGVPLPVAAPGFLVSFSFTARDKDAATAATDHLEHVMRTEDAVPVFDHLDFFPPVQVARDVAPVTSARKVLRLDPAEVTDLMAALMDAIESVENGYSDATDEDEADRRLTTYRALSDKLLVAQRDGIA